MGTTLTGTTPQDTYDSLIKVTDNGPLTGSLKKLTDGLGNDSSLSLSTTAASLSGTLAVTGATTLTDATVTSVSARNSGVPAFQAFRNLDVTVVGSAGQGLEFGARDGATYKAGAAIYGGLDNPSTTGDMTFQTRTADALTSKMTITTAGNVGIGTATPTATLDARIAGTTSGAVIKVGNVGTGDFGGLAVSDGGAYPVQLYGSSLAFLTGNSAYASATEKVRILAGGGITFNGDTAAANALDDYEEGTWTMGVSFDDLSVGVTYTANTGTYTKIGRQVTVNGLIILSSKGSSTGSVKITGLPFTIGNSNSNYSVPALRYSRVSFANAFEGFAEIGTTNVGLEEITEAGTRTALENTDFADDSDIMISLTYFV
jgi:hypothetical protein